MKKSRPKANSEQYSLYLKGSTIKRHPDNDKVMATRKRIEELKEKRSFEKEWEW
ncbi:conserved hypothetical protein [Vibrio aestuarianus]|nr:conserved hypothetical protein [Vibrio aestuarianus]